LIRAWNPAIEKANYKGTRDSLYLYFIYHNPGTDTARIIFNFHDSLNCGSYSLIGDPAYALATDTIGKDTFSYSGFTAGNDTTVNIAPGYLMIVIS